MRTLNVIEFPCKLCVQIQVYIIQIPFNLVDHPPLVVIFEDFEGFSPAVVQNFVSICRYHLK